MEPATLVHDAATFDVVLAPGCPVYCHASVSTNARLGMHSHVGINASVAHDARLGELVMVLPGVRVSGDVALEDAVEPGSTVAGVPARPVAGSARQDAKPGWVLNQSMVDWRPFFRGVASTSAKSARRRSLAAWESFTSPGRGSRYSVLTSLPSRPDN